MGRKDTLLDWADYLNLKKSEDVKKYITQGRITLNPEAEWTHARDYTKELNTWVTNLKEEDKNLRNEFKLATDREPTKEEIVKLAPYASNPAQLSQAISKVSYKEPVTVDMSGQAATLIKAQLGRDATPEEADHFGKLLQQGTIDAYTLNQFLTQTPEYQAKVSETEQSKLKTMLASSDEQFFQQAAKTIQSKYAQAGRPYAGAVGAQMAQEGAKLAANRGEYLAGIQYGDYQRGSGTLQQNYQNLLAQQQAGLASTQGLGAESRNRYYSAQDFYRQLGGQQSLLALQQSYNAANRPSFMDSFAPVATATAATVAIAGRKKQ